MCAWQTAGEILVAQRPDAGGGRGWKDWRSQYSPGRWRRSTSGRFVVAAGRQNQQVDWRERIPRFARASSTGNHSILFAFDALSQPNSIQRRVAERDRQQPGSVLSVLQAIRAREW